MSEASGKAITTNQRVVDALFYVFIVPIFTGLACAMALWPTGLRLDSNNGDMSTGQLVAWGGFLFLAYYVGRFCSGQIRPKDPVSMHFISAALMALAFVFLSQVNVG